MPTQITGLHHLTAIATDPQRNVDFYAGLLGLRMIKKTVNFDDPSAYHLYYGDRDGSPGSIVTFFSWPDAHPGRIGAGQPTAISLSAPHAALAYWAGRLASHGFPAERAQRFGEDTLRFADPDGIPVEIVGTSADPRQPWGEAGIPPAYALRGMHTAELTVRDGRFTEELLTRLMNHREVRREAERVRFEAGPGGPGNFVDVLVRPHSQAGTGGAGTIHHLAFRVADDGGQRELQERLARGGYPTSDVRDRDYFHSIYFRERGGVLFEIATDAPGFAIDEAPDALGTALKLPRQFESARSQIEDLLPALHPAKKYPAPDEPARLTPAMGEGLLGRVEAASGEAAGRPFHTGKLTRDPNRS